MCEYTILHLINVIIKLCSISVSFVLCQFFRLQKVIMADGFP